MLHNCKIFTRRKCRPLLMGKQNGILWYLHKNIDRFTCIYFGIYLIFQHLFIHCCFFAHCFFTRFSLSNFVSSAGYYVSAEFQRQMLFILRCKMTFLKIYYALLYVIFGVSNDLLFYLRYNILVPVYTTAKKITLFQSTYRFD